MIWRYGLEKAMIEGALEVKDLPEAWNAGMKELLGIAPESDKDGCMQDIHWPGGDFGYFPTYTLGAIIAAQFFTAAKKALPDLASQIQQGNLHSLIDWLKTHIHENGSFYSADELLVKATGRGIDVENYKNHLKTRYLADALY